MDFNDIIILALAVSSVSMTLAKSNAMCWFRNLFVALVTNIHDADWVKEWADELIHCPYCLSHSLAAFVTIAFFEGTVYETIAVGFAIVTIASLASLGITLFFLALDNLDRSE